MLSSFFPLHPSLPRPCPRPRSHPSVSLALEPRHGALEQVAALQKLHGQEELRVRLEPEAAMRIPNYRIMPGES